MLSVHFDLVYCLLFVVVCAQVFLSNKMYYFDFQVVSESALRDAKKLVLNAFDENKDGRIDIAEVCTNETLFQESLLTLNFNA